MGKEHHYKTTITWTGNKGAGTKDYRSYDRAHTVSGLDKSEILASSDPSFMGDPKRYNPEELFVASLSGCHMLWYLHLCSINGIVVVGYQDNAMGTMKENPENGGRFTQVVLRPEVTITDSAQVEKANALHHEANKLCFIANSCNFPVEHQSTCKVL